MARRTFNAVPVRYAPYGLLADFLACICRQGACGTLLALLLIQVTLVQSPPGPGVAPFRTDRDVGPGGPAHLAAMAGGVADVANARRCWVAALLADLLAGLGPAALFTAVGLLVADVAFGGLRGLGLALLLTLRERDADWTTSAFVASTSLCIAVVSIGGLRGLGVAALLADRLAGPRGFALLAAVGLLVAYVPRLVRRGLGSHHGDADGEGRKDDARHDY